MTENCVSTSGLGKQKIKMIIMILVGQINLFHRQLVRRQKTKSPWTRLLIQVHLLVGAKHHFKHRQRPKDATVSKMK